MASSNRSSGKSAVTDLISFYMAAENFKRESVELFEDGTPFIATFLFDGKNLQWSVRQGYHTRCPSCGISLKHKGDK